MRSLTFEPQTDQFQISGHPVPSISDTDVLIKVDACGLNPVDAKIRLWKSMVPTMDDCWVPGLDVSGHIAEVGRKVEKWKVGDRVLCHGDMFRPCGGFAEFTVQDAETKDSWKSCDENINCFTRPMQPTSIAAQLISKRRLYVCTSDKRKPT